MQNFRRSSSEHDFGPVRSAMQRHVDQQILAVGSVAVLRAGHTGGSGLGLAICQTICQVICQAHQGHISVKPSTLGGLQMLVSLPIEAQPSAIEPTHVATPTRHA